MFTVHPCHLLPILPVHDGLLLFKRALHGSPLKEDGAVDGAAGDFAMIILLALLASCPEATELGFEVLVLAELSHVDVQGVWTTAAAETWCIF